MKRNYKIGKMERGWKAGIGKTKPCCSNEKEKKNGVSGREWVQQNQ